LFREGCAGRGGGGGGQRNTKVVLGNQVVVWPPSEEDFVTSLGFGGGSHRGGYVLGSYELDLSASFTD